MGMGWTSPNLPILLSATETPLPAGAVTPEQASWISAMFCVGGILGGILFSRLLDTRLGRKGCLTLLVVPQSVSWALLAFAPSASWLYIGRFLIGLSGGGIIVAVPVYVSEISVNRIRGTLGFVFGVMLCTGTFVGFTLTHFFGYMAQPYFALGLCVLFAAGMWPLPDTPRYLMTQQRLADAELAVQFYRQWSPATDTKAIANAMEELRADVLMDEMSSSSDSGSATEVQAAAATHHEERLTWADLRTATTRRGILLGVLLMAMTQFCGSFAIVNYSASIFEAAGSTLHPNVCGMIVAALQSLSTVVFISLIDRVGRKVLIMASGVATSVALAVLGGYFFAQHSGWDVSAYGLLPVVSMSAGMFLVIGVSTLPYVLVVELLPPHVSGFSFIIISFLNIVYLIDLNFMFPVTQHRAQLLYAAALGAGLHFHQILQHHGAGHSDARLDVAVCRLLCGRNGDRGLLDARNEGPHLRGDSQSDVVRARL